MKLILFHRELRGAERQSWKLLSKEPTCVLAQSPAPRQLAVPVGWEHRVVHWVTRRGQGICPGNKSCQLP